MTFASDRMQQNQETLQKQKYETQENHMLARTSRFQFDPQNVMQKLRTSIIGQDASLVEIEKMLKVIKADFNHPDKPLAVTLLLGPTGVGKTETVRIISEAIYNRPNAFCQIDMNTLAQEHYAAALTGAPPGYAGSKEGHTLFDTEAIQGSFSKPGIVLFDEIEKASDEVIRTLLNVLETGTLKLTSGTKSIDFKNSIIFMTSNIGAKQSQARLEKISKLPKFLQPLATKFKLDEAEVTRQFLLKKFDPEFLHRIDRILHYNKIESDVLNQLIDLELSKLNLRLKKQGRSLSLTPLAKTQLIQDVELNYGARGLSRKFRTLIEPVIADFFMEMPDADQVQIDFQNQQWQASHTSE